MSTQEDRFISHFVLFGRGIGLPKSVAQTLGYLLICQPQHQSAIQVQQRLNLSTGSTSRALRMLIDAGITEPVRIASDRKRYYKVRPDGLEESVRRRMAGMKGAAAIAELGLTLDTDNQRLIAMRELYTHLDQEFQGILARMDRR